MTVARWKRLYDSDRFNLKYPSEHAIRFLHRHSAQTPNVCSLALDIGCGAGRHLRLMREMGYQAYGLDCAENALRWDRANSLSVVIRDFTDIGFADNLFDVALAYGVFYYGTPTDMRMAVNEMHRVLRPGGQGLVKTRTPHDWRALGIPAGEPEHGMAMTFLQEDEIADVFARFASVSVELTETSSQARKRWDSDWLITVTK